MLERGCVVYEQRIIVLVGWLLICVGVSVGPPQPYPGTLWTQLSEDAGKLLLKPTGILDIASPDNADLVAIAATYDACKVSYDVFDDNASISKKLPMVRLKPGERGIFNADAWVVLASECLSSFYSYVELYVAFPLLYFRTISPPFAILCGPF